MSGRETSAWAIGRHRRAASVVIAGLVLGVGTACRPEDGPPVASEILREGVDMAMVNMRTFITREGIRRARVEADTAEFIGESEIHLRPATLTFYAEDGTESTHITADYGIYYELTEDMTAEGSVVAIDRVDDQRLETERLRYVSVEDRLYGDTTFTMRSDGGRTEMRGSSFQSDPGLDSVTVMTPAGQTEQPQTTTPGDTAAMPPGDSATGATPADSVATPPPANSAAIPDPADTVAARHRA
ncbi:MAG: LPS export ABC transporter periplasmic protein LptC [Gemmatimonadetes bacterium]|nr:LPS export ABC transporter periplasmic protein LptC [Gemmatimonadota bacterium]